MIISFRLFIYFWLVLLVIQFINKCYYIISPGNVGVLIQLGKVIRQSDLEGFYFKIPFIQNVRIFNIRTQVIPEEFESYTKDLQKITATATVKYRIKPPDAGRIYQTIAQDNNKVYPKIIQPSLLQALKSVFTQFELITIASDWSNMSNKVKDKLIKELKTEGFNYVEVLGLDLTGLVIAEEYRAAIEEKQIADQRLLKAKIEVEIAEQEALKYQTLKKSLDDEVLYKLFLDKWDGKTQVVPALPKTRGSRQIPVIVDGSKRK